MSVQANEVFKMKYYIYCKITHKLLAIYTNKETLKNLDLSRCYYSEQELKIQNWISIVDQLPNERQMVIAFGTPKDAPHKKVNGGCVFANGYFWDFDVVLSHPIGYISDFIKINDVTHWMPLPKPPSN